MQKSSQQSSLSSMMKPVLAMSKLAKCFALPCALFLSSGSSMSGTSSTTTGVHAFYQYLSRFPNANDRRELGHTADFSLEGRDHKTAFGRLVADSLEDGWRTRVCPEDSDNDGQTNGQELGDPNCEWDGSNDGVLRTTDLSDPTDDTSMSATPDVAGEPGEAMAMAGSSGEAMASGAGSLEGLSVASSVGAVAAYAFLLKHSVS